MVTITKNLSFAAKIVIIIIGTEATLFMQCSYSVHI